MYGILKEIFGNPFFIEGNTLNKFLPIAKTFISSSQNGIVWESSEVPAEMHNYFVSQSGNKTSAQTENSIHVLPIRDVILKHDMPCGPLGTRSLGQMLLNEDKSLNVIGHILVIESGGGSAAAIPELTDAINQCSKPVVVWVDGMMASAALYIGSYADYIFASRENDWIGSIGTMIVYEGRKSGEKTSDGDIELRIYADKSVHKNNWYEEALNNNNVRPVIEEVLNPLNETFIADVKANRKNIKPEHLTGRIFDAKQVIGSLIDEVGTFDMAIAKVIELSNENIKPENSYKMKQLQPLVKAAGLTDIEVQDGGIFLPVENALNIVTVLSDSETAQKAVDENARQLETALITIQERDNTISELKAENEQLKQNPPKIKNNSAESDALEVIEEAVVSESDDFATALQKVKTSYL